MKHSKIDKVQLNISVVGLSGSENLKGIHGIGKSCLCNRLAQPNYYKPKHVSTISSTDFYGSIFNQSHWLYWSHIYKEIRGKAYKFHFIEQTTFIDDSSFREFKTDVEPQDFIKRASMTELRIRKNAYICNQKVDKSENFQLNFEDKFQIHLFLLVYDVSEVEKRNLKNQDAIFKQLFDAIMASKRPIIIITTKNDIQSPIVLERFKTVIEKKPYNKFPIVETSAKLDINIHHIYDLAAGLCDNGMKSVKQICFSFLEGHINREKEDEQHKKDFLKIIECTLGDKNIFMTWHEFCQLDDVVFYRKRFPTDMLSVIFAKTQEGLLLKRSGLNNRRFKEILKSLIKEFEYLIPMSGISAEDVVKILKKENEFISHFIECDQDAKCCKFESHCADQNLLPIILLDTEYENNLLFLIDEFVQQRSLESLLYSHLLEDSQKHFKKTMKELRDELTKFARHFIPDKVIKNVYQKFNNHYLMSLQHKFLDIIHENPNIFFSQTIFYFMDIFPPNPLLMNGISDSSAHNGHKISHGKQSMDNPILQEMVKEINKRINFEALPIAEDETNVREEWLIDYLAFLSSKDELECIVKNTCHLPCSFNIISKALSTLFSTSKKEAPKDISHTFQIAILGKTECAGNFRNSVFSRLMNLPLKICKIHSLKFDVEVIDNLDGLADKITELASTGNQCSVLCVIIVVEVLQQLESWIKDLEQLLANIGSQIFFIKYVLCNIDYSTTGSQDLQLMDFAERNKYTIKSLLPENQHQTIDWIVSNAQKSSEQIILWIVTVCGDTYDLPSIIALIVDSIKDILQSLQIDPDPTVTIESPNELIIHNYRLIFLSYHQILKMVIQPASSATVDAIIFLCSSNRLASIKTCIAMKKYLPNDISSSCDFMFLCLGDQSEAHSRILEIKSLKHGIEWGIYNFTETDNDSKEDIKLKLSSFFKGISNNSSTLESFNSMLSNSSSSNINTSKLDDRSRRYFDKTMCQACSDSCRSETSVCPNSSFTNFQNNINFDSGYYDQILGDANHNIFNFWSPEFTFDGAKDLCTKCTKVKCTIQSHFDPHKNSTKTFRTRIRSQSGPDLRNIMDFNQNFYKHEAIFYCSICGKDIKKPQQTPSNRQSFRCPRRDGTKETPQKTFTEKLHDLFNPIKKFGENQIVEHRKAFMRTSSKRHK